MGQNSQKSMRTYYIYIDTLTTVATLSAIVAISLWKWGLFPASAIVVIALWYVAYRRRRWRRLFTTADGAIFWGGLLVWFSAFLTYNYAPMGGRVTQFDLLRNVAFSLTGIGWLLTLSGIFLGAFFSALAFIDIVIDSNKSISQVRYISVALLLFAIAAGSIIVFLKLSGGLFSLRFVVAQGTSAATLIALFTVVLCDFRITAKVAAVHFVGALSMLLGVLPIRDFRTFFDDLASYGIGFWGFCAGTAMIITGSAWMLKASRGKKMDRRAFEH